MLWNKKTGTIRMVCVEKIDQNVTLNLKYGNCTCSTLYLINTTKLTFFVTLPILRETF